MPTFPAFDFSDLDLRRVAVPNVKFPNVKLPNVQLPEVTLPSLDLNKLDLNKLDLSVRLPKPEVDTDRLLGVARDAAYVGIGLTVLAVQQTQVRRRELQRRVSDQLAARRAARPRRPTAPPDRAA